MKDLDFLYYQFMPLYRLPIYSNLAEKRPVIVSASLSSACLPTSLVIHRRRRCFSISTLSSSLVLSPSPFTPPFSSSVSFLFRGKGRTAFLRRWKMRPRHNRGRKRREERERERERQRMNLADERERIRKEDRMSKSVIRSLNTDAGLERYMYSRER